MFTTIDELTVEISRVILENIRQLLFEMIPYLHNPASPLTTADYNPLNVKYENIRCQIERICRNNPRIRLLITTRKIPFSFIEDLHINLPLVINREKSHLIFNHSANLATNYILRYSPASLQKSVSNESLIYDAFRLLILCNFQRILQALSSTYKINAKTTPSKSIDLFDFFVKRQHLLNQENLCDGNEKNAIVRLLSLNTLQVDKNITLYFVKENLTGTTKLVNYFPYFEDAEAILKEYHWLSEAGFEQTYQISLNKFWQCFVLINKYVTERISTWMPEELYEIADENDEHRIKFLFGLTETGLISIKKHEILSLFSQYSSMFPDLTAGDFKIFLDQVTLNEKIAHALNVDDIEKRFLFYPAKNGQLLWDVSEHLAIFRAIAKYLVEGGDEAGNIKGKAFEDFVFEKLKGSSIGIDGLKRNIIVYSENKIKLLEIDIGFIQDDTLYLLEVKSLQRKLGEYIGYFDKSHRAVQYLQEYEVLIAKHQQKIYDYWKGFKINKVVNVLISIQAEYIASDDPALWLIAGEVPRICLIDEFIKYLRRLNSD